MWRKLNRLRTILVPVILLAAGVLTTVYFVENATPMAARLLVYPNILRVLGQHLLLVVVSSLLAIAAAVPLGIIISRPAFRPVAPVIEGIVNIGQTVPSLAVLALFMTLFGLGFQTAVFALWLYSLLPILRNTYAGMKSIGPEIIEAARGMGMKAHRILSRIELPLAFPIIMAGIRTAVVINVGTATLASFIGAGGLGDFIVTGISLRRTELIYTGAALSALLAIFFDDLLARLEKYV